ncbi:MAG TPA: HEAT repeat domain-containing protein [Bacteroidales bacterium]|nr:HEAT repeat domain-containing protein [Bacteroidales bacterium]
MTNKELIKNLHSTNQEIIINTLKFISTDGNKDIMPEVINLLQQTKNTAIKNEIIKILENLKDPNSAPKLVDAIEDEGYKGELPILVSACWKNGLNYDEYIETFVKIFIRGDFQLAFDAFTVMDNMEKIKEKDADRCLKKLETAIEDISYDKRQLFNELTNIIRDKKENPAS